MSNMKPPQKTSERNAGTIEKTDKPSTVASSKGKIFRTLTMPNGQKIKVMREDAFQKAVLASRKAAV